MLSATMDRLDMSKRDMPSAEMLLKFMELIAYPRERKKSLFVCPEQSTNG